MTRIKICVLGNNEEYEVQDWVQACERRIQEVDCDVIDLCAWDWWEKINSSSYDFFLTKPASLEQKYKQLYDERLNILTTCCNLRTYPCLSEVLLYENKRYLSFWLMANDVPHPKTWVFYSLCEALDICTELNYPLVGKTNIGASGRGIVILKDRGSVNQYLKKAFSSKGIRSRWFPKLFKGKLMPRIKRVLGNPDYRNQKISTYNSIRKDAQHGFVIIQEFIKHDYEWRVVRIGDSYFAHKKLKVGEKASGSLLKNYGNPPLSLLNFVKELTDKYSFRSVAVDIFEDSQQRYLVNEIQCIFGQSDSYQMKVDGVIGRYVFEDDLWVFEPGDFAQNACYDLRLEFALKSFSPSIKS